MPDDQPWLQYAQPAAKPQQPWLKYASPDTYEPTTAFTAELDQRLGKGRWKDTGDYRPPWREYQLRNQGAATARGESPHTRGSPDAPGAHDFVPEGESVPEALAKLKGAPGVKDAFYEAQSGTQGGHIHVDMGPWNKYAAPAAAGSDEPWKKYGAAPKPAAPSPGAAPKPAPFKTDQTAGPAQGFWGDVVGEFKHGMEKVMREQYSPARQAEGAVGSIQTGFDTLQALYSSVTVPYMQQTYPNLTPQHARQKGEEAASALTMVTPIPGAGEAGAAASGVRRLTGAGEALELERAGTGAIEGERVGGIGAGEPESAPAGPLRRVERPPYRGAFGREAAAGEDAGRLVASNLPKAGASAEPRQRTLAAKTELPPRTDVVGDEKNPATRTANALYRLGGHDTDAKIELGRASTAMRKKYGSEVDEALYHRLEDPEGKAVDTPKAPIEGRTTVNIDGKQREAAFGMDHQGRVTRRPVDVDEEKIAAAKKDLDPLLERQTAVINRLRERADPSLDPYLTDTGYVHRIKAGDETPLDEDRPRSPFESRKSLVKRADSQKQRKFIALEDQETGERTLIDTAQQKDMKELRPGMEYRPPGEGPAGTSPKVFKVVSPTTKEIEAKVPGLEFQKSAIHNTAVNVYQLERAERNLDILEQTLQDMKERGVAHQEEVRFKGPDGENRIEHTKGEVPRGFKSLPDTPQFKGWVFDHSDAQVQEVKDRLPKQGEDVLQALDRLNNFMLRSDFLSPIVHPKNIAEFWTASRGGEWLNPVAYGRLAKTFGEAAREVYAMGPKYRQLLREGSALLSADSRTQKFTTLLTDSAAKQITEDKQGFEAFKKAFGDAALTPVKMYDAFQKASHKMMWSFGDVMMMQRVLEYQEKGMAIRDAIRKAEEVIPNYRVPAQIMDNPTVGRLLNKTFANNRLFAIGRYHYNRMAAWGRMAKKVAVGTPEEKAEAVGQLLVVAVQAAIVAPMLDWVLQKATGNKNASVKRGGITAPIDAAVKLSQGQETAAAAIAQILDVSPMAELGYEAIKQKDFFGDDVYSKFKSPAQNVASEAELPISQFGPAQGALEAASPSYGPERAIGNMFGVNLPQNASGAVKGKTAKMLRGKYRAQEKKDPLARGIEALGALR